MTSISKLMPSAANFQVEISPAFANLNFDFSLYKVQPPVEFEGVGSALSGLRTMETVGWLSNLSDLLNVAASAGDITASLMIRGDAEASWLNLILLAAKYHLECSDHDRVVAKTLISLGRRHGRAFLGLANKPLLGLQHRDPLIGSQSQHRDLLLESQHRDPLLGSQHRGAFAGLILGEERKIKFLRSIAFDFANRQKYDGRDMFIRYRRQYTCCQGSVYEYATAVTLKRVTSKRKFDPSEADTVGHVRWLYAGGDLTRKCTDAEYHNRLYDVCGDRSPGMVEMNSLHGYLSTPN